MTEAAQCTVATRRGSTMVIRRITYKIKKLNMAGVRKKRGHAIGQIKINPSFLFKYGFSWVRKEPANLL